MNYMYTLLKIALISPLSGWILYICLTEITKILNNSPDYFKGMPKKRRTALWIYLSLISMAVALLVSCFS